MEKYGPWVPIYVVIFITPFMLCVFFFIPETLVVQEGKAKHKHDRPLLEDLKEHLSNGIRDLRKSLDMIKNVNIPLVLLTFLFQSARFAAYTSTLAQYISKHFGWKLAETSLLLSPLGVLNLVLLAGLPKVSQILMSPRFRFTIFGKDLFLTQVSTLLIIAGALIEGFSHNVVLFLIGLFIGTFGAADSPLARATVTHYVDPEFTSRLYALIGMIEVLGSFIGGPVLAFFFDQGLRRKGKDGQMLHGAVRQRRFDTLLKLPRKIVSFVSPEVRVNIPSGTINNPKLDRPIFSGVTVRKQ